MPLSTASAARSLALLFKNASFEVGPGELDDWLARRLFWLALMATRRNSCQLWLARWISLVEPPAVMAVSLDILWLLASVCCLL